MKKKNTKTEEIKKNAISSERPNLFEPNVYISMVVTLSGMITKEELAAAVEKAYAHNEATMSNIVLEKNGEAYYETRNTSGCKVFFDQRNWQDILKESEKKPFALKEGELVRTYITTGTQETILFPAHQKYIVRFSSNHLLCLKTILRAKKYDNLSFSFLRFHS